MVYLVIDLVLFLLVLFVVVPGVMIFGRHIRDFIHQNRKQATWHKNGMEKPTG